MAVGVEDVFSGVGGDEEGGCGGFVDGGCSFESISIRVWG